MKLIRIGRGPNNDAVISDAIVSSSHAVITISDTGEIFIEDLSSRNGTFVNGVRISAKTRLTPSSVVLLGNHSIDWKEIIRSSAQPKPEKAQVGLPANIVSNKLIGRNPGAQIRFSFDDVSDKHAYLCKRSDGAIILIDNQSTNGTFVNGERIASPRVLRKGDNVVLSNKHPLNWEAVYPPKSSFGFKYPAIALAVAAVVALVCIFKPWEQFTKSWTDIYTEHKNDVVLVYVKSTFASTVQGRPLSAYLNGYDALDYCVIDGEGNVTPGISRGSGTGFFISTDGKFLTNRHVVGSRFEEDENCKMVKQTVQAVLAHNGLDALAANVEVNYEIVSIGIVQNDKYIDNESNLIPCTLVRTSDKEELDVALLQTNSKTIPAGSTFVDLSKAAQSDKLTLGTEICTIGFPQSFIIGQTSVGLEANNQSGAITQERGTYQYGHNITIHQGASGSPVYDKRGRFAGIIVSGFLGISQGYNHAIHPNPVISFVSDAI